MMLAMDLRGSMQILPKLSNTTLVSCKLLKKFQRRWKKLCARSVLLPSSTEACRKTLLRIHFVLLSCEPNEQGFGAPFALF